MDFIIGAIGFFFGVGLSCVVQIAEDIHFIKRLKQAEFELDNWERIHIKKEDT